MKIRKLVRETNQPETPQESISILFFSNVSNGHYYYWCAGAWTRFAIRPVLDNDIWHRVIECFPFLGSDLHNPQWALVVVVVVEYYSKNMSYSCIRIVVKSASLSRASILYHKNMCMTSWLPPWCYQSVAEEWILYAYGIFKYLQL